MIDYNQYRDYIYNREIPVIFDKKGLFVFFPTKKAMTTSLTRYLLKDRVVIRKDNKKLWEEYFKKTDFNEIYKFGIIREPISRFSSAFHYIKYKQHIYRYLKIPKDMNKKMDINNYIKKILVNYENPFQISEHFGFQYSGYFCDNIKLVNEIFLLENMDRDYVNLCKKIKLDKENIKENNTVKKEILDEESINLLKKIYSKDIKFYEIIKNDEIVFIHNPKTGGETVEILLNIKKNHNYAFKRVNELIFSKYSFVFVRHPVSRIISWYNHLLKHQYVHKIQSNELNDRSECYILLKNNIEKMGPHIHRELAENNDINDWIKIMLNNIDIYGNPDWGPLSFQYKYIYDDKLKNILVKDVFKFENYRDNLIKILKKINKPHLIKDVQKTNMSHKINTKLNSDSIELIYNYFRKDYELFNYEKEI